MTFAEPAALLLLGFLPLFAVVLTLALRRKKREPASYHIIREVIDSLPLLPRSYLRRRRIQVVLLLTSLLLVGLAAAAPIFGDWSSGPARRVVVLDHMGSGGGENAGEGSWDPVRQAALDAISSMRRDDRVFLLRSDSGAVSRGFITPRRASSLVRKQRPSSLTPPPEAFADYLRLVDETLHPDGGEIVTASPRRWEGALAPLGEGWRTVPAAAGRRGLNYGILDVEIRPDLLRPGRITVFCRVGAFGTTGAGDGDGASLTLSLEGKALVTSPVDIEPGKGSGTVFRNLDAGSGLFEIRLDPPDPFPEDNYYRTPLRSRPHLSTHLFTPGNLPLTAALRSMPGLSLEVHEAESLPSLLRGGVTVYDGVVPGKIEGSTLLFRPFGGIPGLPVRGEVLRPEVINTEASHPLLAGVSFDNLKIRRMPVFSPGPALEVIARADGHPLLMAGEGLSGARLAVLAFDPAESSWIYDPSFPILVANILSWLGLQSAGPSSSFRVGDVLEGEFLRGAESIEDPEGRSHPLSAEGGGFTFPSPGRYRVRGEGGQSSGEVFVNLLSEEASRRMSDSPDGSPESAASLPPLPFRLEIGRILLGAAILLLLAEWIITPAAGVGRLPE